MLVRGEPWPFAHLDDQKLCPAQAAVPKSAQPNWKAREERACAGLWAERCRSLAIRGHFILQSGALAPALRAATPTPIWSCCPTGSVSFHLATATFQPFHML